MNRIISRVLQSEAGRRIEIQLLMDLLGSSLGLPSRRLLSMPSAESLDVFASFSAEQLASCSTEQQQLLHANALRLGRKLRRCLCRRDNESLTRLTFLLYRNIGIEMEGRFPGQVKVGRCHFCKHYTPHICSIASLMDAGVICGLFGAEKLEFSERLTEGRPWCIMEIKTK